jgi:hypothetical protein
MKEETRMSTATRSPEHVQPFAVAAAVAAAIIGVVYAAAFRGATVHTVALTPSRLWFLEACLSVVAVAAIVGALRRRSNGGIVLLSAAAGGFLAIAADSPIYFRLGSLGLQLLLPTLLALAAVLLALRGRLRPHTAALACAGFAGAIVVFLSAAALTAM